MPLNYTLSLIKPWAFSQDLTGPILHVVNQNGFHIRAMKLIHLSKEQAGEFYEVHRGKPFYDDLIDFMSSGPIVAMILEKENAVVEYRKLMGATDPVEACVGTIRRMFAESKSHNAVHGSDSDENAIRESNFFFNVLERY
ncbi:MAG: nucleoside-diphosphate kinase [Bacteroidota bacterium]|nr:nucleoside-diphosphate kinase [Bacteroidota bacterium]MDP4205947.1 nucleoside-diphosphate kinase [Bacteroidota bacterium]